MIKYLVLIFFIFSCSPYYKSKPDYSLPPELDGCKVFLISDGSKDLYVIKCPNEQPTVSWERSCGKQCITTEHLKVVYK